MTPKKPELSNLRFLSVDKFEIEIVRGRRGSSTGYLWIGDRNGTMHTAIAERQMDAIAKHWCRHRGITP